MEAACVPAYLVLPGSPQAKQLCNLHAQLSLGQSCNKQKLSCVYVGRVPLACQASLSVRRVLQARILEHIGQYWLPYPPSAAAAAKSLQLCLTLRDPRDSSPPGSAVPGILQARILEWAAIAFSRPQSTGSQRVRHDQSDPAHIDAKLFLPVAALPQ